MGHASSAKQKTRAHGYRRFINRCVHGVILTAEKFHHDLTLQFGVLSHDYSNEDDYLKGIKNLISHWQQDLQFALNDIFFDNHPSQKDFKAILIKVNTNIDKVLQTPFEKRKFD